MLQSSETERCVRAARRGDSWIQHTAASAMHIIQPEHWAKRGDVQDLLAKMLADPRADHRVAVADVLDEPFCNGQTQIQYK